MILSCRCRSNQITQPTQTIRSPIAACGESWVLKIEFQDRLGEHARPIIIEQKYTWWKWNSRGQEAAVLECCCPLDLCSLWIWQGWWCKWGICWDIYPWLDSRNSAAHAWHTGWLIYRDIVHLFSPPLPPCSGGNKNLKKFLLTSLQSFGFHGFTSGVVKDAVAACRGLIRIQTDGTFFALPCFFSSHFVIYSFVWGCRVQGVDSRTRDKQKTICLLE